MVVRGDTLGRGWNLTWYYSLMVNFSVRKYRSIIKRYLPIVNVRVRAMIACYDTAEQTILGYYSLSHFKANIENICAVSWEYPMYICIAWPLPDTILIGYTGKPYPLMRRDGCTYCDIYSVEVVQNGQNLAHFTTLCTSGLYSKWGEMGCVCGATDIMVESLPG